MRTQLPRNQFPDDHLTNLSANLIANLTPNLSSNDSIEPTENQFLTESPNLIKNADHPGQRETELRSNFFPGSGGIKYGIESADDFDTGLWFWPNAASIVALCKPLSNSSWQEFANDPIALLMLAQNVFLEPNCLEQSIKGYSPYPIIQRIAFALRSQQDKGIWIDWRNPPFSRYHQWSHLCARFACSLAKDRTNISLDAIWIAAYLAPIGKFIEILGSNHHDVAPDKTLQFLVNHFGHSNPSLLQDHREVARRLLRRWSMPDWLRSTIGFLHLSARQVGQMGVPPELVAMVQIGAFLAQKHLPEMVILDDFDLSEALNILGLTRKSLLAIEAQVIVPGSIVPGSILAESVSSSSYGPKMQDPRTVPFLYDLCQKTLGFETLTANRTDVFERELDRLEKILSCNQQDFQSRFFHGKLSSLAEFAAGAGHEINNPLAVISGHAQYLLKAESDSKRRQSLDAIIRQVQRIHQLLRDLMLFARPNPPEPKQIALTDLVNTVVRSLETISTDKAIDLHIDVDPQKMIQVDHFQFSKAMEAVIKNAFEAVPVRGAVSIFTRRMAENESLELVIENDGNPPEEEQIQHMFDPFYSGRSAGRGKGLGLPIAARLSQLNNVELEFNEKSFPRIQFIFHFCNCRSDGSLKKSA